MDDAFAPMGFKDENGEITGFDVDLAKELGYDAGFGPGKYADDVATFILKEMVQRGMNK